MHNNRFIGYILIGLLVTAPGLSGAEITCSQSSTGITTCRDDRGIVFTGYPDADGSQRWYDGHGNILLGSKDPPGNNTYVDSYGYTMKSAKDQDGNEVWRMDNGNAIHVITDSSGRTIYRDEYGNSVTCQLISPSTTSCLPIRRDASGDSLVAVSH